MVSKKNCPHMAPGWSHSSSLPTLLPKDDCGCLQTTTSVKWEQATRIFQKGLQDNFSGWCCEGTWERRQPVQRDTCEGLHSEKVEAKLSSLGASPQHLSVGTGLWQSRRTQGGLRLKSFLRLPLLIQQRHKSVKRPKPWVSEVLNWLKVRKS